MSCDHVPMNTYSDQCLDPTCHHCFDQSPHDECMTNAPCTLHIFGRPLAAMAPGDADCARRYLSALDGCADCAAFLKRRADHAADVDTMIEARAAACFNAGIADLW